MAAKLKVDELESVDGSTNLILNNSVTMASGKTLPAASLTGALPAISGANLTGVTSVGGATGADFNDNTKLRFGTGNDLEIYHDGSNSFIDDSGNGVLQIRSNDIYLQKYTGETMIRGVADGAAELYHNNVKKLETSAAGGTLTGTWNVGKVLQIQYVNLTTEWTISGTSEADLSGLTATITPASTSSKIICMLQSGVANNNSGSYMTLKLRRGNTLIAHRVTERNGPYDYQMATLNYVDSPSTTSATTYKIAANRNATGQHYLGINATTTSLILMEIA